ncbi:MAG TPA: hypothetical protein VIC86_07505, partial [Acidimicrobiales bacterium]
MTRPIRQRFRDRLTAGRPDLVPLVCVLGAVIVANLPAILHLVTTDPLVLDAYLSPPKGGWLPGLPYIDGNAGFTTQALGHLAVVDWLHGHVPWWNPYEGVGAPLAGEMQSGAFFPLTMLLAFHDGMLWLQVTLEAVTGFSTYFLVRKLGVGRSFSTAAGVAFGLCGTYAWLAHAPIRPVALLPLCLLGVELAVDAAREHRGGGWRLLAVALALSILAGFPETTFIDGIFVGWWALLRVAGAGRTFWLPMARKLALGAAIGVALAAPLLAAFADYLPEANVGAHSGGFADASLSSLGLTQLILPYSLGPIFGFHSAVGSNDTISQLWGSVGGFLTVTLIAAGLVGLIGRRLRVLRLGLGAWIAVCLLRTFGFPPVVHLLAVVPGVRLTAFYRYSDPSWELAVVALAALGLDDIARNRTPRRVLLGGAVITGVLAAWAAATAWPILANAVGTPGGHDGNRHFYAGGSLLAACLALTLMTVGGLWAGARTGPPGAERTQHAARHERTRRRGRVLMAGAVAAESVLLLGFTYLSAPSPTALQLGSVHWLQSHLGSYRFVTLGPAQPNYGSYFGTAEANINDLPAPKAWVSYTQTHLDPNAPPAIFTGGARIDPKGPTPAEELTAYLTNYEAVGVRFVLESANGRDLQQNRFPATGTPPWPAGPRLAYRDSFAEIWELPNAAVVFALEPASSTTSSGTGSASCRVVGIGWDQARVDCPHPSILVRRVQYLDGSGATVNGVSAPVRQYRVGSVGLFEDVPVPSGRIIVRFAYYPPHESLAVGAAALAVLLILVSLGLTHLR